MAAVTNYPDEIISAGQLLRILNSDAKEVSVLCQRACLKPKKDGFGNIYFSKSDVDVLRKVKELYEYTKKIQEDKKNASPDEPVQETPVKENKLKRLYASKPDSVSKADTFLKTVSKNREIVRASAAVNIPANFSARIDTLENNVINKISDILSEKLDGLDEVIVELIRAKTENENLRQKINDLNKENFSLKSENASYKAVGLGFYIKKSVDDITF